MSIERHLDVYTPTCDICGTELPDEFDFMDAVAAKKAAGWKSVMIIEHWDDCCPECYELLKPKGISAIEAFGGI